MSDLVKRLREANVWETYPIPHSDGDTDYQTDLGLKAADEIERLEKENEKLKDALRPLADFATNPGPIHITFGDCRVALKVLEESK